MLKCYDKYLKLNFVTPIVFKVLKNMLTIFQNLHNDT